MSYDCFETTEFTFYKNISGFIFTYEGTWGNLHVKRINIVEK